jgi:hypothetical protein
MAIWLAVICSGSGHRGAINQYQCGLEGAECAAIYTTSRASSTSRPYILVIYLVF